jgi:SnoaL-like domain
VTIDGDTACSETYFVSYHGCEKEGVRQLYVFGGRYVDRVERRGREWRYLHRLVVCDWEGMQPVTAGFWWPSPWARGLPSTDDPVYRVWPQTADDAPPAVP